MVIIRLRALAEPADFTALDKNNNFLTGSRQAQTNRANEGKIAPLPENFSTFSALQGDCFLPKR
jgi:hypothetical protein